MRSLCWLLLGAFLGNMRLHAQVEQLATSGDGHILLVHTRFRLQTESDVGSEGKIYRWQDGVWSRLAVALNPGSLIYAPDVFAPFLSSDAHVIGWQAHGGCGVCQIIVGPEFFGTVSGVTLPPAFPSGTLRMSANGRYFTGDNYPYSGVQYVDTSTGLIADVPVDVFTRPVVREIANDGTALLLITGPKDQDQGLAPGVLSLWKPGSAPQPIYSDTRTTDPTISATGGKVAFEAVAENGARSLVVINTQTGERFSVADMPSSRYQAGTESFAKPKWDINGSQLLYRSYDEQGNATALSLWNVASRTSRVLLTNPEGFADAVISGDGMIVWAVTKTNRLLRLDLSAAQTDEILPALSAVPQSVFSDAVPGSAFLIRGTGFTRAQTAFDNGEQLPTVDATAEGLWVQIPWEYASSPRTLHQVLIRSGSNPFEAVATIPVTPEARPQIITWTDPATGQAYAKAVHQDFQSLVTPASPARPGETVHVYLTGLGPLDQPLPTGAPGPLIPLLHPVTPLRCLFLDGPPQPLAMPYLGYAVGMVGFFQADLTIPDGVVTGTQRLLCTVMPPSGTYSSGALLSTAAVQ